MASNELIEDYLSALRERVRSWHRRPDEVIEEAADHLLERIDELERDGVDHDDAAARAIREYGTAREVADAHLRASRRPAIPTVDTRTMGTVAVVGGLGWMALPILAVGLPDVQPVWIALAAFFHATVAASALGCLALWKRHGGLGPLGYMAVVPAVASAPFVLFSWPIPAWTILLGAATLLFGVGVLLRRLAPLPGALGLTFGLALAAASVLGAELAVGAHDEDFAFLASRPAGIAMIVGMIVFGAGLASLGWWMRSEEPVEIPPLPSPTVPG
jgi:hypothetical protein